MASLVQSIKYGAMKTAYSTTMGYQVIKVLSEDYTLQEDTTWDGQMITSKELVLKAQYLERIQEKKKWYCEQKKN